LIVLGAVVAFLVFGLLVAGVLGLIVYSLFLKRHGESDQPAPGWAPTDERFMDPGTGRAMRVWVDPVGGRHYVPEQRG
jgi:hypothetical protein